MGNRILNQNRKKEKGVMINKMGVGEGKDQEKGNYVNVDLVVDEKKVKRSNVCIKDVTGECRYREVC